MTDSDLRLRVVALLTDIDTSPRDKRGVLYHRDARPFTPAEYDVIATCTETEMVTAIACNQLEAEGASESLTPQKALLGLYMKYARRLPANSPDDVYDLMTDEDYAEFGRLADIFNAGDGPEEHAGHARD
jgi:hypothetical protein